MKQKDVVYLVLAVAIFLVAGYVGYTQLIPKKSNTASAGVEVAKIGLVPSVMDSAGLARLNDAAKVTDYNAPVDLSGLGNTAPFGN